jgi:purine-binding chemotaxis protein CheW
VIEIGAQNNSILTGIVVDSVSEVLNIKDQEIEEAPTFGVNMNTEYILGVAKIEGTVKILLEIDKVLKGEELQDLEEVSGV